MQKLILIFVLTMISSGSRGDFSCPDGTNAACLDNGDQVCPGSAKCVSNDDVCFEKNTCPSGGGFICESEYDDILSDYRKAVSQHDELATENVNLREQRLEQKNCVINASTLENAQRCVR